MGRKKNKGKEISIEVSSKKPIKTWADAVDGESQSSSSPVSPKYHTLNPQALELASTLNNNPALLEHLNTSLKTFSDPARAAGSSKQNPLPISSSSSKSQATQLVISDKNKGSLSKVPSPPSSTAIIKGESSSQKVVVNSQNPSKHSSVFFDKCQFQNVTSVESGFYATDPREALSKIFPSDWHYKPFDTSKPQSYYKAILDLTGSVYFKDHFLHETHKYPAYSTAKLYKVITPLQWGLSLHKNKAFPVDFKNSVPHCRTFSYWDYQQAWFNAFLVQNDKHTHSWLFHFDPTFNPINTPSWFAHWWTWWGSDSRILPPSVADGYNLWRSHFPAPTEASFKNPLFHFSSSFQVPWVIQWAYIFNQQPENPFMLSRKFKVKWWSAYVIPDRLSIENIKLFLMQQGHLNPPRKSSKFFARRAMAQAQLAQANNEAEYFAIMEQLLHSSSAHSSSSNDSGNTVDLGEP